MLPSLLLSKINIDHCCSQYVDLFQYMSKFSLQIPYHDVIKDYIIGKPYDFHLGKKCLNENSTEMLLIIFIAGIQINVAFAGKYIVDNYQIRHITVLPINGQFILTFCHSVTTINNLLNHWIYIKIFNEFALKTTNDSRQKLS